MRVYVKGEREYVRVYEKGERVCLCVKGESVCACVCRRERESVYVCEKGEKRERVRERCVGGLCKHYKALK